MHTVSGNLAILMPKISGDYERFSLRYAGLSEALGALSVPHFFTESHTSYDAKSQGFHDVFDVTRNTFTEFVSASVVRDLTMCTDEKPLYEAPGIQVVHHPETSRFLADKSNLVREAPGIHPVTMVANEASLQAALDVVPGDRIIIKPSRGMMSQGVRVVLKTEAAGQPLGVGDFLVQEFIDTSAGVPELGIEGKHNLRAISIDGKVVGAIARVGGTGGDILKDDIYGAYVGADELPEGMQTITNAVHDVLAPLPGNNHNVIAIDLMRGTNATGERVDVLCEVNRRPLRISKHHLLSGTNGNPESILAIAAAWDKAEAAMLYGIVAAANGNDDAWGMVE